MIAAVYFLTQKMIMEETLTGSTLVKENVEVIYTYNETNRLLKTETKSGNKTENIRTF